MPQFDIAPGTEVDWGQISQLMNAVGMAKERQQNERIAALRWEGEQDYQTLIDSGVDAKEAFRRTSRKIFAGDPAGLARSMDAMKEEKLFEPKMVEIQGRKVMQLGPQRFQLLDEENPNGEIKNYGGVDFLERGKQTIRLGRQQNTLSPAGQADFLKYMAENPTPPESSSRYKPFTNYVAHMEALMPKAQPQGEAVPQTTQQPQASGTPDIEAGRALALEQIKKVRNPGSIEKIRQRFKEIYGQDL